jgi:hypothetical protein
MTVLLLAAVAWGETPERSVPQGFGKAKFGMTVAEVKASYPELQPAPPIKGYLSHPDLERHVLFAAKVGKLPKPMDIELRFWKGRLWMLLFYNGKNSKADVDRYLVSTYGEPVSGALDAAWVWPGRSLVSQTQHGWFSLSDRTIGKEAQAELAKQRTPAPPLPE